MNFLLSSQEFMQKFQDFGKNCQNQNFCKLEKSNLFWDLYLRILPKFQKFLPLKPVREIGSNLRKYLMQNLSKTDNLRS